MSKLDQYLRAFANLRTDVNRNRWSEKTNHRAPHKPFLLMSIMDLIDQGIITSNFIEPSFELVETFNSYWKAIMPPGSSTSMAYPFPRLRTGGFWKELQILVLILKWNTTSVQWRGFARFMPVPRWMKSCFALCVILQSARG